MFKHIMFLHIFVVLIILLTTMPNILILLAHPDIKNSFGNKTIIETVKCLPNVTITDLTARYPDFNIDIAAEQQALILADLIILQYPIYWYNMPPILKQWFDKVFTFGFAFGKGSQLANKAIMASVTAGSKESSYPTKDIKSLFKPLKASAKFCKIHYLNPIISYDIYYLPHKSKSDNAAAIKSAQAHANQLKLFITNYKHN